MRWQVHGTDAGTGQPVTLEVQHAQAVGAVQTAMSKRILVTYVTAGTRLRAMAGKLLWGVVMVLAVTCVVLLWKNDAGQEEMRSSQLRQAGLVSSLADANGTIGRLQQRVATLEKASSGGTKEVADELDAARVRAASLEKELIGARGQVTELQKGMASADLVKGDLAAAKEKLANSQKRVSQLDGQLKKQNGRVKELETQVAGLAAVEKANKDLAGEVEALKAQALALAVKSEVPAERAGPIEPAMAKVSNGRWAMTTGYDQAMDFMAMRLSHDGVTAANGGDGTMTTTAMLASNAATMRVVHDMEKHRVYAATLTLPVAGDGPKDKLAENVKLVNAFVKAMAPGSGEVDGWVVEAIRQLAGKDTAERVMRVGADYKLTVWNNRVGVYSWKVESPRGELE